MKGKGRMPLTIMLMGVVFNVLRRTDAGQMVVYLAPEGLYADAAARYSFFWLGVILFFMRMRH